MFYPCPTPVLLSNYTLVFIFIWNYNLLIWGMGSTCVMFGFAVSVCENFVSVPLLLVLKRITQIMSRRREMKKALRRERIMNWKR